MSKPKMPPGPWDRMTPEQRAKGEAGKAAGEAMLRLIEPAVLPIIDGKPLPDVMTALTMLLNGVVSGMPPDLQAKALADLSVLFAALAAVRFEDTAATPTRADPHQGRRH